MDDLNGNKKKKKGEVSIVGAAAVVLAVCICFIVDVKMGIGAILGAAVGFFCWRMLGDSSQNTEEQKNTFLDTEVLRENFSIPKNMPVPYAVLDMRGHILMYNEPFAKVFPEMEKANAVVEQLKKVGTGKKHLVEVDGRFYEAVLNQCDVVAENGAVGMVLRAHAWSSAGSSSLPILSREGPMTALGMGARRVNHSS